MSLDASTSLSVINQKRPDNLLIQLGKMKAEIEEMYAAIAAGANTTETDLNSHINNTSNPHSVTKSQAGLGNVDNYATASQAQMEAGTAADKFATAKGTKQAIDRQIKGTSWTQENGLYVATDQIRARDSGGLILGDDSGQGLLINDGGIITSEYQPSYSAKVTSDVANFSGDGTTYNLTGAIFTEQHDIGSCLSNGTFTARVSSKKYRHGLSLWLNLSGATFTLLRVQLVTSNETFTACYCNANAIKYATNGNFYETWSLSDINMDASDTAYWQVTIFGATKAAYLLAGTTIFGGLGV